MARQANCLQRLEGEMQSGTLYHFDWQIEQIGCQCIVHRYHVAHICECGKLYSHSQGDCDEHRGHDCINFDPFFYRHGSKAKDTLDLLNVMGLLPYGSEALTKVFNYASDNW